MNNKSVGQAVREFVTTCPFIQDFSITHIDFTGDSANNCGVADYGESSPLDIYMDGSVLLQHNFSLFARGYTIDDMDRLDNIGFVEHFSQWIRVQSMQGNFPDLGENRTADSMEAANGALFDIDENGEKGLYQIQFHLIYQERKLG